MLLSRAWPAWALVCLSAACSTVRTWREIDAGSVPFEDVWEAVVETAEVDGYVIDVASSDRGLERFQSQWRTVAMPFRRSSRKRVRAEIESRQGHWIVRFFVEEQVLGDVSSAFDPAEDDWKASGQDARTESRLAAKLRTRFRAISGG